MDDEISNDHIDLVGSEVSVPPRDSSPSSSPADHVNGMPPTGLVGDSSPSDPPTVLDDDISNDGMNRQGSGGGVVTGLAVPTDDYVPEVPPSNDVRDRNLGGAI
jgi:hypothetical protein